MADGTAVYARGQGQLLLRQACMTTRQTDALLSSHDSDSFNTQLRRRLKPENGVLLPMLSE